MILSDKIPTALIGLLGQILHERYTRADLESLFLAAGAPDVQTKGNKQDAIRTWLRHANATLPAPMKVLGAVIDDFMEMQAESEPFWGGPSEFAQALEADKKRIREALAREGLTYSRGGTISKGGSVSTLSLDESVKKHGLTSVDIEIQRALSKIEEDPHAAAQYAGNVLEASLKAYLDHKKVAYSNGAALAELWKLAAAQIGLKAEDLDNKDLKKIASGLHSIVDGIAHLRNAKSGAHGKSEEQRQSINIRPRHARLAIHAAHTVAAYVLELIE